MKERQRLSKWAEELAEAWLRTKGAEEMFGSTSLQKQMDLQQGIVDSFSEPQQIPHRGVDFGQIDAFVNVASHESVVSAAEALGLTPRTITVRLVSLEHELGEKLFERKGKAVGLTDTGRMILPYARKISEDPSERYRSFRVAGLASLIVAIKDVSVVDTSGSAETRSILFADTKGSTAITEQLGAVKAQGLKGK